VTVRQYTVGCLSDSLASCVYLMQTSGNTLTIKPVKDEDYGVVSCLLSNVAGNYSATYPLRVIGR